MRLHRRLSVVLAAGLLALSLPGAASAEAPATPPVTDDMLLNASDNPNDWLMVGGNYSGWNYSTLDQINKANVDELVPVWTFSSGQTNGHEAQPIVNDGVMYVTGAFNTLFALDATSGDLLWKYERVLPDDVYDVVCCDVVNRGVGLYGDKVYMTTLDSHVIAFDAHTGEIVWDKTVIDYSQGYAMTASPVMIDGKILVGVAGGEYGVRGFVAALDAETGEEIYRTYTIPGPGEPGNETWPGDTWKYGGASTWIRGTYDPELNLVYWGTSNGGPWMGDQRPGDNYWVASVVAFDADTGELKWGYQFTPNDSWDYDANGTKILADIDVDDDGTKEKVLFDANRNAWFYVIDRETGDFIHAKPYATQNVFHSIDPETGYPDVNLDAKPTTGGEPVFACPAIPGPRNWQPMAFDPESGLTYTTANEWCNDIAGLEAEYRAGETYMGYTATRHYAPGKDYLGAFKAIDVKTGNTVWEVTHDYNWSGPPMVTDGGLVFTGTTDRYFYAFDSATGDELWKFRTNSGIVGQPSTFTVDGKQYVAVWSGQGGVNARGGVELVPELSSIPEGGVLWVFALPDDK